MQFIGDVLRFTFIMAYESMEVNDNKIDSTPTAKCHHFLT